MEKDPRDVIIRPVITEHSYDAMENNVYTFEVAKTANKIEIAKAAEGFVYCVSSLGVTGVRSQITTDIGAMVRLVKAANPDIPCAVGFGISTPEQAQKMALLSDGAIVGSAIVKLVAQYGRAAVPYIRDFTSAMKAAVTSSL